MAIKYTVLGLLIYVAIAAYILAFVTRMIGFRKLSGYLYFVGFIAAVTTYGYRWHNVQHVPLQNLFEVFVVLGLMVYPISMFCRYVLRVKSEMGDMVIGAIVLFPAGFVFSADPQLLPPALQSWLFVPHVAVYMLAYIIMAKACIQAFKQLFCKDASPERGLVSYELGTYRMICFGFPLLTLGLILGSYWGKMAWGDYWNWDPKEMWSLAAWLVYLTYFHFRRMYGKKHENINSVWAITGMGIIVITLLWVNLSKIFAGLHNYTQS